jgi:hypothetical protein
MFEHGVLLFAQAGMSGDGIAIMDRIIPEWLTSPKIDARLVTVPCRLGDASFGGGALFLCSAPSYGHDAPPKNYPSEFNPAFGGAPCAAFAVCPRRHVNNAQAI